MTEAEFVKIGLERHFNDSSEGFANYKQLFINRLKEIYANESSIITKDNMDSILFHKYNIV